MKSILIFITLCLLTPSLWANSTASFPKNINEWILVKESIIPGKNVELPEGTSLFIQNTVRTYNWINQGKGTKLNIYVPKEKLTSYKTHGPYADGPTAVGIYEDSNIIFVTEHIAGEAIYGTYDREGNDISSSHPSFNVQACIQCHTSNKDICMNGTCATPIIDIFQK